MTHWQIMMCSYFIHAKSAQRAWISFMLLNKHGKTVVLVIDFADWRILMRNPRKSWGKLMNILYCSKQSFLKSCLSQSLNSVFQLNFDLFFFTIHAYNFTPTRNLISSKDLQRSSNHWDIHQGKPFLLFCVLADQPARPNGSEKIRLVGYIKRAGEQLKVN